MASSRDVSRSAATTTRAVERTRILARVAGSGPSGVFLRARATSSPARGQSNGRSLLEGATTISAMAWRRHPTLLGERLRQPPCDPHPALLLSLRRPVLPVVPKGHRSRESRFLLPTGRPSSTRSTSGRQFSMCCIPTPSAGRTGPRARAVPRPCAGLPELWHAQRPVRTPLAATSRRHAPQARAVDLATIPAAELAGQPLSRDRCRDT